MCDGFTGWKDTHYMLSCKYIYIWCTWLCLYISYVITWAFRHDDMIMRINCQWDQLWTFMIKLHIGLTCILLVKYICVVYWSSTCVVYWSSTIIWWHGQAQLYGDMVKLNYAVNGQVHLCGLLVKYIVWLLVKLFCGDMVKSFVWWHGQAHLCVIGQVHLCKFNGLAQWSSSMV